MGRALPDYLGRRAPLCLDLDPLPRDAIDGIGGDALARAAADRGQGVDLAEAARQQRPGGVAGRDDDQSGPSEVRAPGRLLEAVALALEDLRRRRMDLRRGGELGGDPVGWRAGP